MRLSIGLQRFSLLLARDAKNQIASGRRKLAGQRPAAPAGDTRKKTEFPPAGGN